MYFYESQESHDVEFNEQVRQDILHFVQLESDS
jgi:hypothetical protein